MNATEPIRCKHQVHQFINYYLQQGQLRNYVLATMCVHTALRISDVLALKYKDVYNTAGRPRQAVTITEKKTGKTKTIALHKNIVEALNLYRHTATPWAPLFLNNQTGRAITRVHAYRILRAAAEELGFGHSVSCHSLRKTFGYHSWKAGVSPAVIMEIYNHSSLKVIRRYLGVHQDDMNTVYLGQDYAAQPAV